MTSSSCLHTGALNNNLFQRRRKTDLKKNEIFTISRKWRGIEEPEKAAETKAEED